MFVGRGGSVSTPERVCPTSVRVTAPNQPTTQRVTDPRCWGARVAWANTVDETIPVWIDAVRQQPPPVRTVRVGEHLTHALDQLPGQRSGGLRGIELARPVHGE